MKNQLCLSEKKIIVIFDKSLDIISMNDAGENFFGDIETNTSLTTFNGISSQDLKVILEEISGKVVKREFTKYISITNQNHIPYQSELTVTTFMNSGQKNYMFHFYIVDTNMKAFHTLKYFFDNSIEGYFIFESDNTDILINHENLQLVHSNSKLLEITDNTYFDIDRLIDIIDINQEHFHYVLKELINEGYYHTDTKLYNQKTNRLKYLNITLKSMVKNNEFTGFFGIILDNTKDYFYESELSYLANKDLLTGMSNRRKLIEDANKIVDTTRFHELECLVAIIDIDHFKSVNDTYGHDIGDVVLQNIACSIDSISVDDQIVTGRYGGEEFLVVSSGEIDEFEKLIEHLRTSISQMNIKYPNGNIKCTISSGIASCKKMYLTIDEIISKADTALYESKKNGRNQVTIYDSELHGKKSLDRLTGTYNRKYIDYQIEVLYKKALQTENLISVLTITLSEVIVKDNEIVQQYLKQNAIYLQTHTQDDDIVGRYSKTCLIVLFKNIDESRLNVITNRLNNGINDVSGRFNNLLFCKVVSMSFNPKYTKLNSIYKQLT